MELFFYQAECGDSARIRFKDSNGCYRNILIDSGYERTFRHVLKNEIKELTANNEQIDICVISHIHDDHIGGILKYIKTVKTGELEDVVVKWFYNPPRKYNVPNLSKVEFNSTPTSISQGDELFNYINSKNKLLNYDIVDQLKPIKCENLRMSFLSPSKGKLESLRKKYKPEDILLEKIEDESISEAVSTKEFDYSIKVEDFNLEAWEEDTSIENGSSISLLTELGSNRILWLADSHPSDVVHSLKKLGYSNKNKILCEWVKVSHHGSAGNSNNELYSLINCNNYLVSANGTNKHYLPTKESLVRILMNKDRNIDQKYSFHLTYDNKILRNIFAVDDKDIFKKWNFEVNYLTDSKYYHFNLNI